MCLLNGEWNRTWRRAWQPSKCHWSDRFMTTIRYIWSSSNYSRVHLCEESLEVSERLNVFLESSGNTWKDESVIHKKELNKALVSFDCKSVTQFEHPTSSRSASRNKLKCKRARLFSVDNDQSRLKMELLDLETPFQQSSHFLFLREL